MIWSERHPWLAWILSRSLLWGRCARERRLWEWKCGKCIRMHHGLREPALRVDWGPGGPTGPPGAPIGQTGPTGPIGPIGPVPPGWDAPKPLCVEIWRAEKCPRGAALYGKGRDVERALRVWGL